MCGGSDGMAHDMVFQALDREFFDRGRFQKDVAAELGCGQSHLSLLATGRRRITASMAARMERLGWPGEEIWLAQAIEEFNAAQERLAAEEPREHD
jgi:plasmid maintenance system antidote protein VapI